MQILTISFIIKQKHVILHSLIITNTHTQNTHTPNQCKYIDIKSTYINLTGMGHTLDSRDKSLRFSNY